MEPQAPSVNRIDLLSHTRRGFRLLRARLQDSDGVLSIDGLDVAIRALAVAVTVALNLTGFGQSDEMGNTSAWVLLAIIIYNALVITLLGVPFRHPPGFALFVIDWLVASAAITATGGFFSSFVVLYYALAIGAALRLGFYRSLVLVVGCAAVFAVLTGTTQLLPGAAKLPIIAVEITSLLMVVLTTVGMRHTVEVEAQRLGREAMEATRLRRLNYYTQAVLSASPGLGVALQAVATAAKSELFADRALAVLTNEGSNAVMGTNLIMAADGFPVPPQLSLQEAGLLAEAVSLLTPVTTKTSQRDTSIGCAPLVIGSEVLGAVFVYFDGGGASDIDVERLKNFGTQMAMAIRLSRLYEQERERATRSEESERVERDLLSVVSHELRTPLTAIKTSVGALNATRTQRSNPVESQQIEGRLILNLERSTERLILLVDELLDMARLRARRITLNCQPLNVPDLITEVVAQAQPILDESAQVIKFDLPPCDSDRWDQLWVLGDRRRLEQVMLNLLSNANKYAPKGSRVVVGTTAREGNVRVFVRDEGPGLPHDEQVKIFEKFYQTEAIDGVGDNGSHGLGLGLAIARAIVELHGGSIGVTASVGKGSTFHFSLPLYDGTQHGNKLPTAADRNYMFGSDT